MTEDDKKAIEHAEKRLRKLMRRYGIVDAVEEIGKTLQEFGGIDGAREANAMAHADLPGGDVAVVVFSLLKKEELEDHDGPDSCADDGEEWANAPESYKCPGDASWVKCAEAIDRFRDKVSAYYGFKAELIMPVSISDTSDPLWDSTFTVLGIEYAVHNAVLTCVGEVQ